MSVFSRAFWTAAVERAVKTAAQSGLLALAADQVNVLTVDWPTLGGFMAGGFVLSVLTSLGSIPLGQTSGPSLANEVAVTL